jgi:hypothetical protein
MNQTMNVIIPLVCKWLYLEDIINILFVEKAMQKRLDNYFIWECICIEGINALVIPKTIIRFIKKYTKREYYKFYNFSYHKFYSIIVKDICIGKARLIIYDSKISFHDSILRQYNSIYIDKLYIMQSYTNIYCAHFRKLNVRKVYIDLCQRVEVTGSIIGNFRGIKVLHIIAARDITENCIRSFGDLSQIEELKVNNSISHKCFKLLPKLRKLITKNISLGPDRRCKIPGNIEEIHIYFPTAIDTYSHIDMKKTKRVQMCRYRQVYKIYKEMIH